MSKFYVNLDCSRAVLFARVVRHQIPRFDVSRISPTLFNVHVYGISEYDARLFKLISVYVRERA
jgi:hypothetical protein